MLASPQPAQLALVLLLCLGEIYMNTICDDRIEILPNLQMRPAAKVAMISFLSGSDSDKDGYSASVKTLVYRLLHHPYTKIPLQFQAGKREGLTMEVAVMVTENVAPEEISHLLILGARVLKLPRLHFNVSSSVARWQDNFTKLHLWKLRFWAWVFFIDADMLLVGNITQ